MAIFTTRRVSSLLSITYHQQVSRHKLAIVIEYHADSENQKSRLILKRADEEPWAITATPKLEVLKQLG